MNTEIVEKTKLSKNILFLYFNRLLIQIAFGLIAGFGTLFFYEKLNESLPYLLVLYGVIHLMFALSNHISAKFMKKYGVRKMMVFALISLSIMFLSRMFWDVNPIIVLIVYSISYTIYKAFYWIPYHVEFAKFTDKKSRGRQMALLYNTGDVFAAIIPFFAGFLLTYFGYDVLFISGFVFIVLSIIPLFKVEEVRETYTWDVKKLIHEVFDKDNRPLVLAQLGFGMQNTVAATIWPVFVFILTEGDYIKFGSIFAIVAVVLIVLRAVVGGYLDSIDKKRVLKFGNIIFFSGWVLKALISSITGIFVIDIYHKLGNVINQISYDATIYDQAADNGHYIDEYTVLKESVFLFGRSVFYFALIPVVIYFGIKITFVLAAFAALLMTLVSTQKAVR